MKLQFFQLGTKFFEGKMQEVVFFKKEDKIPMSCRTEVAEEISKLPPKTKIVVWFSVKGRAYKDRHYAYLTLMHWEKYVSLKDRIQEEEQYKKGNNNTMFGGDGTFE